LDAQGTLVERQSNDRLRMGRALPLLFPRFPKGVQREGASWEEPVEWNALVGEWRVAWRALLKWRVEGFSACDAGLCADLSFEATLTPTLLEAPAWARGQTESVAFKGRGSGRAVYDVRRQLLLSNSFAYSGLVTIGVRRLEEIPWDQRVGSRAAGGPGSILLQIEDKADLRKQD
jgi:hypothetical protein